MIGNIFGIIFILMAVKNHTTNFADSSFGPDYYSSSNEYDMHKYVNMVTKEALGPTECSQPSNVFYKIVFTAKNINIRLLILFFIFQNFLCIFHGS